MKYLLAGVVVAILILGFLASKNNDKRDELAAAKAQQSTEMMSNKNPPSSTPALSANQPPQDVSATTYVQSLQRAQQSAKDVAQTQDEYMKKMKQAEQ